MAPPPGDSPGYMLRRKKLGFERVPGSSTAGEISPLLGLEVVTLISSGTAFGLPKEGIGLTAKRTWTGCTLTAGSGSARPVGPLARATLTTIRPASVTGGPPLRR